MPTITIIYTTCPSPEVAQKIADQLLNGRLVACANIIESKSNYFWEGELQHEGEYLAICKTTNDKANEAIEKIKLIHPHQIPAVLSWQVEANETYAQWVTDQVNCS